MTCILQIPRSDASDGSTLLVKVDVHKTDPLDISLTATEGEYAYTGAVRKNQLDKLKSRSYPGNTEQWRKSLLEVLHVKSHHRITHMQEKLEASAAIAHEMVTISIRENIDGIVQKIGSIHLHHSEDQEVELFDWTNLAANESARTRKDIATLTQKIESQSETIVRLTEQLEKIASEKATHEELLLKQFQDLLNSKKLKIRDQQRIMLRNKEQTSSNHDDRTGSDTPQSTDMSGTDNDSSHERPEGLKRYLTGLNQAKRALERDSTMRDNSESHNKNETAAQNSNSHSKGRSPSDVSSRSDKGPGGGDSSPKQREDDTEEEVTDDDEL
ncbi:hypothetical protein L228DRAFT_249442 [Xylona heveae TC161]|uniref:Uncharacterized protein n=1 Tax=Xylona heveae (strain CBS 132557 / TC161) TaxID=1328760 RepID=A0A165AKY4_XYLHT|nr:hypothetical protein L228DRAFT_249442 [Xylona heveae TC161]KZF20660.1 hypothetical protein L228DRAFT_249442 [Xylona heveae TC161]